MSRARAALCALLTLAGAALAQQPSGPVASPVPLTKELKTPLLKRVTIEKPMDGTTQDILKQLAEKYAFKIDIDPPLLKAAGFDKNTKTLHPVKDVRLDVLLNDFITASGRVPTCKVLDGTLWLVEPEKAAAKLPNGRAVIYSILQPPDATHTAAVNAVKKKLATKVDFPAGKETPLFEFLQDVSKKHELQFRVNDESFRAAGVPNVLESKPTIKGGKGVTLESVLRGAIDSVGGTLVVDPYGRLTIAYKENENVK